MVEEHGFISLQVNDELELTLETGHGTQEYIEQFLSEDAKKAFNLQMGPLYRFKLFKVSEHFHILYINIHHLIWDGRSGTIFFKLLEKTYNDLKNGRNPNFSTFESELYTNYQRAQTNYQQSEEIKADLLRLKAFFPTTLTPLQLPTDRPRPKVFSHDGGMIHFEISADKMNKYVTFCREQNITLYNYFFCALSLMLKRFSGQNLLNIGTATLGRSSRESQSAFGFFANTSVIPIEIDESKTVREYLRTAAKTMQSILLFKKIPFGHIVNSFLLDDDSSRLPLYQSFFMFQDFTSHDFTFMGQPYTREHMDSGMSHGEIDLWVTKYPDKISGGFHYAKSLFLQDSVSNMQAEFLFILDQLHQRIDVPVIDLEKISPTGLNKSLRLSSNFQEVEYESFLNKFVAATESTPEKIAVISDGESLTYLELDILSTQLSRYLLDKGIKKGDLVAVSIPRSVDLIIGLLAVLKSDCGYLPIDAKFPKDRIEYMIEHSKVPMMLTTERTKSQFPKMQTFTIEDFKQNKTNYSDSKLSFNNHKDQTAYIIYTSGSTGNPKGVELSLGSVTNFLKSMERAPGLSSSDTLCAVTTLSFDISVLEIFLPLMVGGTLVLATEEEAKDSQELIKLMAHNNVTVMQATPITWRLLFKSGWEGSKNLKVLCGGEKMPEDLAHQLIRSCKELWNMYGPTETTVWSTCKKLNLTDEIITIGHPIDNTAIYILDKDKNHLPVGAIGEIYIGGDGLAKGYLYSPKLTEERFSPDPFRKTGRMYITGDLGRLTSTGEVICLGRSDNQVKVRGHRIELGEIQIQLSHYPTIREAVVIIREFNPGDVRLVAYIIQKDGGKLNLDLLKEALLNKLPPYMVPEHVVTMESFPLTPNGKIDQKNLPSPFAEREKSINTLTPPKTDTEMRLAKIWQKEIGIPMVYLEDDFFQIGGNSLAAVSVFQSIFIEFKQNIDLALLFSVKSLKELAQKIDEAIKSRPAEKKFSNLIKIQKGTSGKRYYFFHAIGGNTLNYRIFLKRLFNHDVFGLQTTGVDGQNIRFRSIEEMARDYVQQIVDDNPEGPYHLVGGSLGGLLAYECARVLQTKGKKVAPIIMFDTSLPKRKKSKTDSISRMEEKKTFNKLVFKSLRMKMIYLTHYFFQSIKKATPHSIRYSLIEHNNLLALRKYQPGRFNGSIYLLRIPLKEKGIYSRRGLGWEDYVDGEIYVDFVDAPHHQFIESEEVTYYFGKWVEKRNQ